jgi:hypothetical protein
MAEAVQGMAHGLSLRIENRVFHPDVNMRFHEFSLYEGLASFRFSPFVCRARNRLPAPGR